MDQTAPDIPGELRIAAPMGSPRRLMGSNPASQLLLRSRNGGGTDGDPGDVPPTPPPPVSVAVPDLAIQFKPCLPDSLQAQLVGAVKDAIDPNADVRAICYQDTGRIGIWLLPSPRGPDEDARDRGVQRLALLGDGESIAFFINSALISGRASTAWINAPKRLNGDGQPDPNGPIHLTGFSVSFNSPSGVVTTIDGFDERPWPDVDFRLVTTDTLSVSGGEVLCGSDVKLDVDTDWLNFLAGISTFLAGVASLWFTIPAGIFLAEGIVIGSVDAPDVNAGAGCGAASLIPKEILIPGGLKVVFRYARVSVSDGCICAGGDFVLIPRNPIVSVFGATQLVVTEGATTVLRTYATTTNDLLSPLQFTWSGDGSVLSQGAQLTAIRFGIAGAHAGQVLTKRVAVRVSDRDHLVAQAELTVQIHVIADVADDGLPPVCRVKPWLPECQR